MPYYEIDYETGRTSVAFYEDDDEAKSAVNAHNNRAVDGKAGGPTGAPAERVKTVRKYKSHPDNYNTDQTATVDVATKELAAILKVAADENGVVNLAEVAMMVQGLSHPMVTERKGPGDSIYKMKEDGVLKWEDN